MSATYERLSEAFPERVGRTGFSAPLDDYVIDVVDLGTYCKWSMHTRNERGVYRFILSGKDISAVRCWRDACDALDEHRVTIADGADR